MPTAWETFPVELRGGLVTNISPLQQGLQSPGSARKLVNFEPSVQGGYRRILGFEKTSETFVPTFGNVRVQGSGQTGTTLLVADIHDTPAAGDVLTIGANTYTVVSAFFSSALKTASIVITPALAVSPADKATVIFSNRDMLIDGILFFNSQALVQRGGNLYSGLSGAWSKVNIPSYGTTVTPTAGQTGASFTISGIVGQPQAGDTFYITGIEKVYTLSADPVVTAGSATVSVTPNLNSATTLNAPVVWLSSSRSGADRLRFARHDFTGTKTIIGVDGVNKPFRYTAGSYEVLHNAPSDVVGATHVVEFKSTLFYANGNKIAFTAPLTDGDFSAANGAGVISLPHEVTGMIVFREQLIIFSRSKIHRLVGNTISDFNLQPISLDIGCIYEDTIQEVGGDIMFVATDGVRFLSATDRLGDFNLAVASRSIQSEATNFFTRYTSFASCVVREKSQYRLFGFNEAITPDSSQGLLATQFSDQSTENIAWAELGGFKAYVVDSIYSALLGEEVVIFAHSDGFVYQMEKGNSLDGEDIISTFYTPFFSFTDPRIRKTFYKLNTYVDPMGSVTGTVALKLDFDQPGTIQPNSLTISNLSSPASFFGTSTFGASTYGGRLVTLFNNQLVGSGFTASLAYNFQGQHPPFSLDAIVVEFQPNDRQ